MKEMDIIDYLLAKKKGSGSQVTVEALSVTENGTYSEAGKAYSPVTVEVPLGTKSITNNGTYNASSDELAGYSSVTVAVEGFKKKSIANTPTDIASFNDGTANPMSSLEISIEPVQSGSGDPSPQNVRPISGWTAANVTACGKNLFDKTKAVDNKYWASDGEHNGNIYAHSDYIKVNSSTDYYSNTNTTGYIYAVVFFDENKNLKSVKSITTGRFTTDSDTAFVILNTVKSLTSIDDMYVVEGSTATSYSPYQGSTSSIPFHDSSDNTIIVYGGRLNVTSGELTLTLASVDMGTLYWTYDSERDVFASLPSPTAKNLFTGICSVYPFVGSYSNLVDKSCAYIYNNYIAVRDHDYADATAFKAAMNGVQFVYELATSQTYQLTPTQVATLLGQNNIFADCGQILEGEYFVAL